MRGANGEETIEARRSRLSAVPRACEGCKTRKIRCDRSDPCSNCRSAGISCQKASRSARPDVQSRSERDLKRQIERLEERLFLVESRLEKLGEPSEGGINRTGEGSGDGTGNETCANREDSEVEMSNGPQLYQGSSSFTAQSIQATEVAQTAAMSGMDGERADVNVSLGQLETLLQPSDIGLSSFTYSFRRDGDQPTASKVVPLPQDFAIAVMQEIKRNRPVFMCSYAVSDISMLERLCQRAYFPIEPATPGHLASLYGILSCLLKEFTILRNPLGEKYDLKAYERQCEENFRVMLETYHVLAVPSFENILALIMGFTKAQDVAKPLLCSTLISSAANHCQMLGYSHEVVYRTDRTGNAKNMRRAFWTTYVFDRQMSLLFGRSPVLDDADIDAEYPSVSTNPAVRAWDESFIMAIRLAKLQGHIYKELFSPSALKLPREERQVGVDYLSSMLQEWFEELLRIQPGQVNNRQVFDLSRDHWDVMYYSTLTTLLRASTQGENEGAEINTRCFGAAQLALRSHLRCFSQYQGSGILSETDYANWILLSSSFTPFIAVFLHAISARSPDDIQLLEEVVSTLNNVKSVSKSCENLYQICFAFVQIARGLMVGRASFIGTYNQGEDALQFPLHHVGSPVVQPQSLHALLGADLDNQITYSEVEQMSHILDCWVTGTASGMNFWAGETHMS